MTTKVQSPAARAFFAGLQWAPNPTKLMVGHLNARIFALTAQLASVQKQGGTTVALVSALYSALDEANYALWVAQNGLPFGTDFATATSLGEMILGVTQTGAIDVRPTDQDTGSGTPPTPILPPSNPPAQP